MPNYKSVNLRGPKLTKKISSYGVILSQQITFRISLSNWTSKTDTQDILILAEYSAELHLVLCVGLYPTALSNPLGKGPPIVLILIMITNSDIDSLC